MPSSILDILKVKSFKEAEIMLQEQLSPQILNQLLDVVCLTIGNSIEDHLSSLILDIIYNQPLTDEQQLNILAIKDYNITDAFFQHHRDNRSLSLTFINRIIHDDSLLWVLEDFIMYYPVSQSNISLILRKIDQDNPNLDFIYNLTSTQALNEENILYLLTNFESEKRTIQKFLIGNQPLSDEFIEQMISDQELRIKIIESQHLDDKWIKFFFNNIEYEEHYYNLLVHQSFSESMIDFLFNLGRDSLLYSLVRLQPLVTRHKIQALESSYDSVVQGVFIYQRFSNVEEKIIKSQFPEYLDLLKKHPRPDPLIDVNSNKRMKRDLVLKQKRTILLSEK